jgi:hypothetical protein
MVELLEGEEDEEDDAALDTPVSCRCIFVFLLVILERFF